MANLVLGIVADDFTGASDAASFLTAEGIPTILYSGIPQTPPLLDQDTAVVIALKTRTAPVQQAVQESIAAFEWLAAQSAQTLYLKYCSTFDSTKNGNIGPVVDAVLDRWGFPMTLLCPSLPVNGRTVRDGCLYVNGIPLSQSHMRDHPLTPMRDSHISRLMEQQAKYKSRILPIDQLLCSKTTQMLQEETDIRYWIPDYFEESHGDQIAERFESLPFLTGGSGLVGALGRRIARRAAASAYCTISEGVAGKALILAGSCSKATLGQIADHIQRGLPAYPLHPEELICGRQSAETLWAEIQNSGSDVLVYSSAEPAELEKSQLLGREKIAALIEATLSEVAKQAALHGYTRFIVAGGETSGAVTTALGYHDFSIGASVAPGVPVLIPLKNKKLRLVLKSGNFGQEDFFARALDLTQAAKFIPPMDRAGFPVLQKQTDK